MPRWSQYIQDIPSRIRSLNDAVKAEAWGPRLISVLEGLSLNSEDINRKIPYASPENKPSGGLGGGVAVPSRALWTLEYMTMHLKPKMQDVTYVKFEHDSTPKKLFGTAYSVALERMMGEIYIESETDQQQHRYYVDMRPVGRMSLSAGSLVGFSVGFGQFGAERLRLRIDTTEYRRPVAGAEIVTLSDHKHSSCKWASHDELLDEPLLSHYQTSGLQMFLTLTIYGR